MRIFTGGLLYSSNNIQHANIHQSMIKCLSSYILNILECFAHGAKRSGRNMADTSFRCLPPSHFLFGLGYLATCNTLSGMVGTYSCWLIDKILHQLKIYAISKQSLFIIPTGQEDIVHQPYAMIITP